MTDLPPLDDLGQLIETVAPGAQIGGEPVDGAELAAAAVDVVAVEPGPDSEAIEDDVTIPGEDTADETAAGPTLN